MGSTESIAGPGVRTCAPGLKVTRQEYGEGANRIACLPSPVTIGQNKHGGDAVTDRYEHLKARAESLEKYLNETRREADRNPGRQVLYDLALAEYYLSNHLHGRTFTDGGAQERAHLDTLRDNLPVGAGAFTAYNVKRFQQELLRHIDNHLASLPKKRN